MATLSPSVEMAQAETQPPRLKLPYDEFLAWALKQTGHYEWVNEEVITYMSVSPLHQDVVVFLTKLLGLFVDLLGLGKVSGGPAQVKLPGGSGREPDAFFLARARLGQISSNRVDGPVDLVIEVVSDDSVSIDRDDKFYEYEAAGITEYWVVDLRPNRRRAYFYQLTAKNQYHAVEPDATGVYHSVVLPGFWLKPEWIIGPEFPNPLVKLIEIVGQAEYTRLLAQAQAQDKS